MAGFSVLFKKELKEQLRTYKLLIVVAVFFVFGLATPLLLKYMSALLPKEGPVIPIPQFTSVDSVREFVSTVGQVGLIAAILIAMGAVAKEREMGTAVMTLSKPVGRGAFIVAKLLALALTFGAGLAVGGLGCYLYTVILFGSVNGLDFLMASLLAGLYLLVCLTLTLMYSSLVKSQLAAGGLALVSLIGLAVTSALPVVRDYGPGALLAWAQRIAGGSGPGAWGALIASSALVAVTTLIGWQAFKRREL